jgi:hypothetical protein
VQSSPPFGVSSLELPAVTIADRAAAGVGLFVGPFLGYVLWRHGLPFLAVLAAGGTTVAVVMQAFSWTRSRLHPPRWLECAVDGQVQVRVGGGPPGPARLRSTTRRLGPSVFLDVEYTHGRRRLRYRRWLTALDVPADALRRWSVVLPTCGRAACS